MGRPKGSKLSEETKRKIGIASKRAIRTAEWKENIRAAKLGHTHSEETKKKISESKKGSAPWNKGKKFPQISGSKNNKWNGGKRGHSAGYILLLVKNHPFCNKSGYVYEHRIIMEKHIERFLDPKERVHHVNGIKNDNRIDNLILFSCDSDHQKYHHSIKTKHQTTYK